MRVLITGAAGFIGSHLYQKLKSENNEVIGIDNFSHASKNPINNEILRADILNHKKTIDKFISESDIVYHLAAQIHVDKSIKHPKQTIETNVLGTSNILESCRKHGKKLVFASSSEVYGTSQTEQMGENHPLDAQSPYGASKIAGDRLCKSYIDTYGMDIAILRSFNTFGPYQDSGSEGRSYGAVIGIFTLQALTGEPITIFGDGEQRRDYMYIQDALRGYELASNYRGVINIGSGCDISINYLAEKIIALTGSKSEIKHINPRPGEVMRLCADITKARSLGFNGETDFDKHLAEYIAWHKENYDLQT